MKISKEPLKKYYFLAEDGHIHKISAIKPQINDIEKMGSYFYPYYEQSIYEIIDDKLSVAFERDTFKRISDFKADKKYYLKDKTEVKKETIFPNEIDIECLPQVSYTYTDKDDNTVTDVYYLDSLISDGDKLTKDGAVCKTTVDYTNYMEELVYTLCDGLTISNYIKITKQWPIFISDIDNAAFKNMGVNVKPFKNEDLIIFGKLFNEILLNGMKKFAEEKINAYIKDENKESAPKVELDKTNLSIKIKE